LDPNPEGYNIESNVGGGPRRQATLFEAFKMPNPSTAANNQNQSPGQQSRPEWMSYNVGQTPKGVTNLAYAKAKQAVLPTDNPNRFQHPYDPEAVKTWLYPSNRPIRDYQINIVQTALFTNTLVALPTGLGKTFIAAVVMYNYFRWFPEGKIIFMAPTKPLVAQQVEACYNITGIPQESTDELTGASSPQLRRLSWMNKRVFFLTPQVLQNDLNRGTCLAEKVVLLVVDEAHRALGKHAYCEVIRGLCHNAGTAFRVLALTATPGAEVKTVQTVIENLMISKIEIRTEDSLDIKPYTHERILDVNVVPMSEEMVAILEVCKKVIGVNLNRLATNKAFYEKDPLRVSRYMLITARDKYRATSRDSVPASVQHTVEADFGVCMSLCDAVQHLVQHGIRFFLKNLESYIEDTQAQGNKVSKARADIVKNRDFQGMVQNMRDMLRQPGFTSHPKLQKLVETVVGHFLDHQEAVKASQDTSRETRVMIFSNYRESVLEIVDVLSEHQPLIRVMSFVGQSSGKKGSNSKGFTQKEQLEVSCFIIISGCRKPNSFNLKQVISKFQSGNYNVLVSTCIGEEGLDIGEVDLIVCFDAQNSPIRMLQRMGRTGRKRQGKVVLLLAEGKEEDAHRRSQMQYKTVQKAIIEGQGKRLDMHPASRMLPVGINPTCVKTNFDIPKYDLAKKNTGGKSTSNARGKKAAVETNSIPSDGTLTVTEQLEYQRKFFLHDIPHLRLYPSLQKYTHWQTMVFSTYTVKRSERAKKYVQTVQFMEVLSLEEEQGNPNLYGAEMQKYLDYEDMDYISEFSSSSRTRKKRPKATKHKQPEQQRPIRPLCSPKDSDDFDFDVIEEPQSTRRKSRIVSLDDDRPTALELLQQDDDLPEVADILLGRVREEDDDFREDTNSPPFSPISRRKRIRSISPVPPPKRISLPPLDQIDVDQAVDEILRDLDPDFGVLFDTSPRAAPAADLNADTDMDMDYDYNDIYESDPELYVFETPEKLTDNYDSHGWATKVTGPFTSTVFDSFDQRGDLNNSIEAANNDGNKTTEASKINSHPKDRAISPVFLVPETPQRFHSHVKNAELAKPPITFKLVQTNTTSADSTAVAPSTPICKLDNRGGSLDAVVPTPSSSKLSPENIGDPLCRYKGSRLLPSKLALWPELPFASQSHPSHPHGSESKAAHTELEPAVTSYKVDASTPPSKKGANVSFSDSVDHSKTIDVDTGIKSDLNDQHDITFQVEVYPASPNANALTQEECPKSEQSSQKLQSAPATPGTPLIVARTKRRGRIILDSSPASSIPEFEPSPGLIFRKAPTVGGSKRVIQDDDDDEDNDELMQDSENILMIKPGKKLHRLQDGERQLSKPRRKELEHMFDSSEPDFETENQVGKETVDLDEAVNDSMEEEDDFDTDGISAAPTPLNLKMVRRRLQQKKERRPPRQRGSPVLDTTTPIRPKKKATINGSNQDGKKKKQKFFQTVPHPYYDIEAELSSEVSDSGDEIVDGNIDVDLDGFIVDDGDVSYMTSAPNTVERNRGEGNKGQRPDESPLGGMSMYHRSLLSPNTHGLLNRGNEAGIGTFGAQKRLGKSLLDRMFDKHRSKENTRQRRGIRDEWEGPMTQFGEGAEANEYYDDEELADFVVDDDDELEFFEDDEMGDEEHDQGSDGGDAENDEDFEVDARLKKVVNKNRSEGKLKSRKRLEYKDVDDMNHDALIATKDYVAPCEDPTPQPTNLDEDGVKVKVEGELGFIRGAFSARVRSANLQQPDREVSGTSTMQLSNTYKPWEQQMQQQPSNTTRPLPTLPFASNSTSVPAAAVGSKPWITNSFNTNNIKNGPATNSAPFLSSTNIFSRAPQQHQQQPQSGVVGVKPWVQKPPQGNSNMTASAQQQQQQQQPIAQSVISGASLGSGGFKPWVMAGNKKTLPQEKKQQQENEHVAEQANKVPQLPSAPISTSNKAFSNPTSYTPASSNFVSSSIDDTTSMPPPLQPALTPLQKKKFSLSSKQSNSNNINNQNIAKTPLPNPLLQGLPLSISPLVNSPAAEFGLGGRFHPDGPSPLKDTRFLTREEKAVLFVESDKDAEERAAKVKVKSGNIGNGNGNDSGVGGAGAKAIGGGKVVEKVYQVVENQIVLLADNREVKCGVSLHTWTHA
jgi:Fanconi anemia group M protein